MVMSEAAGVLPEAAAVPSAVEVSRDHRWLREILLVVVVYFAYDGSRLLANGAPDPAIAHGNALLRWEGWARLNPEPWLNDLFSQHISLGLPADYIYATLHYLVTPLVLIWMWREHKPHYRLARTQLGLATAAGLIGFLTFPTAPPRLLDSSAGFTDVMAQYSSAGWWAGDASTPRGLEAMTNDFAAMPSLHVGWALWCGLMLFRYARHRAVRIAGLLYPILILLVVMGTGNHYLVDGLAGAAVMIAAGLSAAPYLRLYDALAIRLRARWESLGERVPTPLISSPLTPLTLLVDANPATGEGGSDSSPLRDTA